jgi:hypothetical protein
MGRAAGRDDSREIGGVRILARSALTRHGGGGRNARDREK